jgi:hypothetical protein
MKENIEYIIGSAVAFIGIVVAYFKSNPKSKTLILGVFTKLTNRVSGKTIDVNFEKLSSKIGELGQILKKTDSKVDKNQEEVLNEINNIKNKIKETEEISKKRQKQIADAILLLNEKMELENLLTDYRKRIFAEFNNFKSDRNVNKYLEDVLIEGVRSSIDFAKMTIINNGLANLDTMELLNNLKSNFRILQTSETYNKLGVSDIEKFKETIEETIVKPLLQHYIIKFSAVQKSSSNLKRDFLDINLDFSIKVIKQTYLLFEKTL